MTMAPRSSQMASHLFENFPCDLASLQCRFLSRTLAGSEMAVKEKKLIHLDNIDD